MHGADFNESRVRKRAQEEEDALLAEVIRKYMEARKKTGKKKGSDTKKTTRDLIEESGLGEF